MKIQRYYKPIINISILYSNISTNNTPDNKYESNLYLRKNKVSNTYDYITRYSVKKLIFIHLNLIKMIEGLQKGLAYMLNSSITINYCSKSSYEELLTQFDAPLLGTINSLDSKLLRQPVYLYIVDMQPQNLKWKLWKSKAEMSAFLINLKDQLDQMKVNTYRKGTNGDQILNMYSKLIENKNLKTVPIDQNQIGDFNSFINQICRNPYLKKCDQFLLFIDHCVSVDKWDMKIYKQIIIYKSPSVIQGITGFFGKERVKERKFFITLTSDGLLKSDNHLQESRITMMIPFTNQMTIQCKRSTQNHLSFIVQSCAHEQLAINFFKDYAQAINFAVAIKMALDQSSISNLNHRFSSYAPIRKNCASKLYVDGAQYYEDLYNVLISAKWQVCITGWMITPYFMLVRPNSINKKQFRLDGVLQSLAKRGVKIYIVCFMEPKIAVNNDSEHVQIYLESLHDNIKVYRHPNDTIPILWSHHQKMVVVDQQIGFMGGLDICYGRWDYSHHLLTDPEGQNLWDGADYNNYRTRDITQPRKYQESNLNREFEPRMPWHDIALQFRGDIVLDLLRHFVQYFYFAKSQLSVDAGKTLNFIKKRYEQAFYSQGSNLQEMQYFIKQIAEREKKNVPLTQKIVNLFRGRAERYSQLLIQKMSGSRVGNETMQMCRSASDWTIGVRMKQHQSSIHEAYITLIQESKKFIYIQNQFFMGLQNKVVQTLAERIRQANSRKQQFKIIVVMPLLPGFQGDIADPNSSVLRIQVHLEYQAIIRGQNSLIKRLQKYGIDYRNYVHFFGLRQSQYINGTPRTEIIYVHSKLMIVDDCRCIIGSANINDRSLLGTRDSELACVIDSDNGNIRDLRYRLFAEHFGLPKQRCDPFPSEQVWNQIITNSVNATKFYSQTFGCIPDDSVFKPADIATLQRNANIKLFDQYRGTLKGHAVEFPLMFMKDENLQISFGKLEYFAPAISFT